MTDTRITTDPAELRARMERYIMRRATRYEDWDAFSYENDPRLRRAQLRYIGGGGSAKHDDPNVVPAEHFTLSVMRLPPGCVGAPHAHEVEEVFFILQGEAVCFWWENGVEAAVRLGAWDMMYSPAGVMHGFRNESDADAYVQVLLGKARPDLPTYADAQQEARKRGRVQELARGRDGG